MLLPALRPRPEGVNPRPLKKDQTNCNKTHLCRFCDEPTQIRLFCNFVAVYPLASSRVGHARLRAHSVLRSLHLHYNITVMPRSIWGSMEKAHQLGIPTSCVASKYML
jgi:hypothetical protein